MSQHSDVTDMKNVHVTKTPTREIKNNNLDSNKIETTIYKKCCACNTLYIQLCPACWGID